VNQGVNWNYADQNETVAWYSGGAMAHGYDVDLNDGNGLATIGQAGESGCWVPGQWVEWNVTNTLKKWYGTRGRTGQYANDGFLMYESMNTGYGGGIFASRNNTSSSPNYKPQLFITWEGDLRPIAEANGAYQVGYNQNVQFSSTGTYDPDCGLITALKWDFNLDNVTDATGSSPSVSYSYLTQTLGLSVGQHVISLRAEDNENDFAYDFANLNVLAVPEPATVTLLASACLAGAALRRRRR
jgi:hypothetical protein